jgi:hypothetical protein
MKTSRRKFVRDAALGISATLLSRYGAVGASFDARIEILLDEVLGTISPNIYGHFTENLGGVIYDGIWVGESSKVGNVNGIRKSLVDALQKMGSPVIRWPADVLRTATTGKMALDPPQNGRGGRIFGQTSHWFASRAIFHRSTIRTNSAPTSLCSFVNCPAANPILLPTSVACRL